MNLTNEDLLAISELLASKLKLNRENVIMPQIRILAENYLPAAKRYEKSVSQIETMQTDINMLKHVVSKHSKQLQNLA